MKNVTKKGYARLIMVIISLQLVVIGLLALNYFKPVKNEFTLTGDTILTNDKVKIAYYELENGDFDVLVTPLGDYNVSPEFSLEDTNYYQDAYLVGKTKTNAMEHHLLNSGKHGIEWDFNWNSLGGE